MAKQTINIGSAANDGTGDTLRAAFTKTNHNFTEVYGSAQEAFNQANTGTVLAQAAFDAANGVSFHSSSIANGEFQVTLSGTDGTMTVPGVITGTETTSSWTDTITDITLGEETIVTLSNNHFGGPVIGQILISNVAGTTQINGTWYYQAWNSNQVKLFTDLTATVGIDSTTWVAYDGGGDVTNLNSGGLSIQANFNTWDFNADGNLYVPGNVVIGGGNNSNGNEEHLIIDSNNYWTSIQWKNYPPQDPNNTPFECQAQLLRVFANDNTVTAWCNVQNPREELVAVSGIKPNGTNYNGLMFSTSDIKIPDAPYNDGEGIRHDWILHGDGTTQLPNMPTNGRTGNADALIFTKMNGRTGQKVIGTQSGDANNPTVERLIIAGGDGYGYGEGGDIYLWAGRSSYDAAGNGGGGGDIKVDAGDAYDSYGGEIKIRGGNALIGSTGSIARDGGHILIQPGSSWTDGGNGGDLTLYAGNAYNNGLDGTVNVNTGKGSHIWNFGADGNLSIPQNGLIVVPKGAFGIPDNTFTNVKIALYGDEPAYGIGIESGHTWISGHDGVKLYSGTTEQLSVDASGVTIKGNSVLGSFDAMGSGDPAYPTALDLTKSINKLTDNAGSNYTLADGVEGQIMHLVPKDGAVRANIWINIDHVRILSDYTSTAAIIANPAYYPFTPSTSGNVLNVVTLIFTDGAWNVSGGSFDY